jgi:hypothetical protein
MTKRFDEVNVPISEQAQRAVGVRGLGPDQYNPITGIANKEPALNGIWERFPERDKRIHRGDDYAGDAWRNKENGAIAWVVPGHVPSYARAVSK